MGGEEEGLGMIPHMLTHYLSHEGFTLLEYHIWDLKDESVQRERERERERESSKLWRREGLGSRPM